MDKRVSVGACNGRLRLVWTWEGRRRYLYLGLDDNRLNRIVAEQKAKQMEADLVTENFDPSLAKYKSDQQFSSIDIPRLFDQFTRDRSKLIYASSLSKYFALGNQLREFFGPTAAGALTEAKCDRFREWLGQKVQPITLKERITLLRACWEWGQAKGLVRENPWAEQVKRCRVPPKQRPKPFTKAEIQKILIGFKSDRYYSHYADYVAFRLGTGCRPGEASGLRWRHLADDCSWVWIGEAIVRGGIQKETKTNRDRRFGLPAALQQMLQRRREQAEQNGPDDLVFPAPGGGPIDDHNFRNRAWKKVLTAAGVNYRRPYYTRHTFISHGIESGKSVAEICEITGHDPDTLFAHYLGSTSMPAAPELWEEEEGESRP